MYMSMLTVKTNKYMQMLNEQVEKQLRTKEA